MKLSIKFILNTKNKNKTDLCTLSMRIIYERKQAYQDTGKRILKSQYDEKEASKGNWRVIKNHPDKDRLNSHLKKMYDNCYNIENELILKGEQFTSKIIKDKLRFQGEPAIEAFKRILKEDRTIKPRTKEAIKSTITRLTEFAPDIMINQIDYSFGKEFESWLLNRPSRTGGTLHINTVNKYLKDLSTMLSKSIKYKLVQSNQLSDYDHIKEPKQGIKTYTLSEQDLYMLETVDLSEKVSGTKLDSVRFTLDAFLFGCYTGLRLENVLNVCPDNYKDGVLTVYTSKGDKTVQLPLDDLFEGKGLDIFKKYSRGKLGQVPLFGGNTKRSTHQGNIGLLKALYFPCKKFSFHSSRHTFGTILRKYMNLFDIQALMAHSDVKTTTKVYAKEDWDNIHQAVRNIKNKAQ